MTTETLLPDALVSSAVTLGNFSDLDEGVSAPDGNGMTLVGTTSHIRLSFPTPSRSPKLGAGLQTFRVRARRPGGSATNLLVWLAETGGSPAQIATQATGASFVDYSFTWDASALGAADGSAVQLYLTISANNAVQIDAVDWVVELSDDAQPVAKRIGGVPFMALTPGVY